jgi:hypothetical protein
LGAAVHNPGEEVQIARSVITLEKLWHVTTIYALPLNDVTYERREPTGIPGLENRETWGTRSLTSPLRINSTVRM